MMTMREGSCIASLLLVIAIASFRPAYAQNSTLDPDIVAVINVVGEKPGGKSWADSYSVGDRCYCRSTYDHDVDVMVVNTPLGWRNVTEVCALLGPGPGWTGHPIYNDIQCGNGPPNNAGDEQNCPGRVDLGQEGCGQIGPKWNFADLIGIIPTTNTTPPRRADPDIVAVVPGVVGITNPKVKATPSSYSIGNECYCLQPLDPLINTTFVDTPEGWMTVGEICDLLGPGPGSYGRPLYNDVQCGNGPATANNTEIRCPGRVDKTRPGCAEIGPTWNFERISGTMAPSVPIGKTPAPTAAPSTSAPAPVTTPTTVASETPAPTTGFTLALTGRPSVLTLADTVRPTAAMTPSFDSAAPFTASPLSILTPEPTIVGAFTSSPVTEYPLSSSMPTTDAPYSSAPTTDAPYSFSPATQAPFTSSPETQAPFSSSPETQAPFTYSPETQAPFTYSPETQAPFSSSPETQAPFTYSPETQAPFTYSPETQAPFTFAPTTAFPVSSSAPVFMDAPTISPAPTTKDEGNMVIAPIALNFEPQEHSGLAPSSSLPTDPNMLSTSSSTRVPLLCLTCMSLLFATVANFM